MGYVFYCKGHKNITARHKTTIEFTKDKDLTIQGDCILGVSADYKLSELKKFSGTVVVRIEADGLDDAVECTINPDFSENGEIVIRKTSFLSDRTFGINSDKAACDINRLLIEKIKKPIEIKVSIDEKDA